MKMNVPTLTIINKASKLLIACMFLAVNIQVSAAGSLQKGRLKGLILSKKTLSALKSGTTYTENTYSNTAQKEVLPLLTKEEIKESADNAFKKGLFLTALDMYTQLKAFPSLENDAAYGLALTHIQLGHYEEAFDLLSTLLNKSKFTVTAQKLTVQTALTLAETAQKKGDFKQADTWLNTYEEEKAYKEDISKYARLTAIQTNRNFAQSAYTTSSDTLRIALLLPLTGDLKSIGKDLLRSTQIALFNHGTKEILLYPHDTKGTADGARLAAKKAFDDHADIIIGPLTSQSTDAIAPFAKNRDIPVISFSSNEAVADKNILLLSYMPAEQAKLIARHAFDLGKRRFAALIPDSTYGHKVFKAFNDEVAALGGEMITQGFYNPTHTDHSAPLEKMVQLEKAKWRLNKERQALEKEYLLIGGAMDDLELMRLEMLRDAKPQAVIDFDALFIPAPAASMALISSQLAFYDIDAENVLLLGTALWDSSSIYENRAEYLRGARFVAPRKTDFKKFEASFQKVYGNTPHPLAALSYDALAIVSQAFKENPRNKGSIAKKFLREGGFSGVSGAFRFTKKGIPERVYNVLEVHSKGLKEVMSAPTFMPALPPKSAAIESNRFEESFDNFFPW